MKKIFISIIFKLKVHIFNHWNPEIAGLGFTSLTADCMVIISFVLEILLCGKKLKESLPNSKRFYVLLCGKRRLKTFLRFLNLEGFPKILLYFLCA